MSLELLKEYCAKAGYPQTEGQIAAFELFRNRLYEKNRVMNLTRVAFADCELRHFIDSLLIVDLFDPETTVLDIGCGPGFPAWPIANARPDLHVTALDSSGKMLGLLRELPLPNLEIHEGRAEEFGRREAFDVLTARAVAPLPALLEISAPFVRVHGRVLPFRTHGDREVVHQVPLSDLGLELETELERTLPGTDVVRYFPVFRKVRPTPAIYPRSWGQIKHSPLIRSARSDR